MNEDIIRQVDTKFYEKHEPELGDTYTEFMEEWNTMEMWEKEKCEYIDNIYNNKNINNKAMNKEELKELRAEISILRTDVYTILYMLYNFMKKPGSVDFETFYKKRFKDNKNVED